MDGPFQILEVRHGSLKIAVSPSLGGEVIVALAHVKKWAEVLDHDEELENDDDFPPMMIIMMMTMMMPKMT